MPAARSLPASLAGLALLAPAASAEQTITAGPLPNIYSTPTVTIDQGEKLLFQNLDVSQHDVTAKDSGAGGRPRFQSALVGQNQTVPVEGAQQLTTGSYAFFCSVHPFMTGTLNVSSAGTPLPGTSTGPKVSIARTTLRTVERTGRLKATVSATKPGTVSLSGNITSPGSAAFGAGGGSKTVSLRLSSRGRRAIRGKRSYRVTLVARAGSDEAETSRTIRR